MSSRRLLSGANRQGRPSSTAASSSSRHHENIGSAELPEYEPPTCPLDPAARRALTELAGNTDKRKYAEQLGQSLDLLSKSVAGLNDRFVERRARLEDLRGKRQAKAGDAGKEKGDFEAALEVAVAKLRASVPGVTQQSEAAVRELIDWKVELQDGKEALQEAGRMVEEEQLRVVNLGERRMSRRRRKRQLDDEDQEDEEARGGALDDLMDEDDEEQVSVTGPLSFHDQAKKKLAADYEGKSMYQRYGLSNDYIHFKKLWHDAAHGADRKPLPNAKQWFNEDGPQGGEDSDEDLIVAEEVIDLKCPLSLVMMREPYTSKKCKHTFEKAAIFEFLQGRTQTCPQTGCNMEIAAKDLYLDEVMLRRIKRAQADEDRSATEDDEDDDVGTKIEEDGDVSMRIKTESRSRARARRRQVDEIEDGDENMEEVEENSGEDEDE